MPVYNEGANGFHLFTIVTDGYGNLVAETDDGRVIAEVKLEADTDTPTADHRAAVLELTGRVWDILDGQDD